jgi:hypothetical protein
MNILDNLDKIGGPDTAPLFLDQHTLKAIIRIIEDSYKEYSSYSTMKKRTINKSLIEPLP